jgi:hypothetical protein
MGLSSGIDIQNDFVGSQIDSNRRSSDGEKQVEGPESDAENAIPFEEGRKWPPNKREGMTKETQGPPRACRGGQSSEG